MWLLIPYSISIEVKVHKHGRNHDRVCFDILALNENMKTMRHGVSLYLFLQFPHFYVVINVFS